MRLLARATVFVVAAMAPLAVILSPADASASAAYTSPYTFEQTFGTALRLIRVDLGLKITEKDIEGGYFLFEYTSTESGKRVYSGSIEVVGDKERVHVTVQLPALPSYHEQMIIDALVKKLVVEHGEPPKKQKPKPAPDSPPPPPPDNGEGSQRP
jgi:hypothetical protein